jgi:hypothetical protein
MKRLISLMIIFALLVPSCVALAEGEGTPAAQSAEPAPITEEGVFAIDTQHVYPGMDKSYALGYMPKVADGTASLVLPLIVSGGAVCDTVTAGLDLGDPSAAPFVFKNYVSEFKLGTYALTGGEASCCLVSFSLELQKDRKNGSYPVTVHAEGTAQNGMAITGDFTLYVVIEDGKSAGSETPREPKAKPQPKLVVESYKCSAEPLEAGAEAALTVTLKNTSSTQAVKNIKLSFKDESGEILPETTGSVYIEKIRKGGSAEGGFDIRVAQSASARAHVLTVTMEYENGNAAPFSSEDIIVLDVTQRIRLEYEQPALPAKVTEGDNVAFSMNIMNLGKSIVYNVLLTFEIPGLNNGGSVLVGNLQPGEAKAGASNLLVSPVGGLYGDTSGSVLLSYENEAGEQFKREIALKTRIEKKVVAASTDTKKTEEKGKHSLPWWAWGGGGVVIITAAGLAIIRLLKSRRQREIDERRL